MKILGLSKVSKGNRITLTEDVAKELNIKLGDNIVFEKDDKDNIVIMKG